MEIPATRLIEFIELRIKDLKEDIQRKDLDGHCVLVDNKRLDENEKMYAQLVVRTGYRAEKRLHE